MSRKQSKSEGADPKSAVERDRREGRALHNEELDHVTGGSQSTGAGAGKVTFNPFSITRKIDKSSPTY
jgi:type VI protein secretion system component Hcp